MKVLRIASVCVLLAATGQLTAQTNARSIIGAWESEEKDVRMEYFNEGDHYNARLLWGKNVVEADGTTSKKDDKNPDDSLRSRNIIGIVSLAGLKWNGKEYTGGTFYDPRSGKTYNCKVWIDGDKLHLRGYLGFSLIGRTVLWHRFPANTQ
jgi:uncharacterized protein (DUF2147 family)